MIMELMRHLFSKGFDSDLGVLQCSAVEVEGEEERDLVTLEVLLIAVKLLVILEEIYAQLEAAASICPVDKTQNLIKELWVCNLNREESKYFDLFKVGRCEFWFRYADDELAQEVEIQLSGNFFIDALVDVIVLV